MNNEPVAWMFKHKKVLDFNKPDVGDNNWIPLYTHPVKELTLTDEKIDEVYAEYRAKGYKTLARAILRKAQEK